MLIVAALAVSALAYVNLFITKRLLHPAFIYAAIWAIQLLALVIFGDRFIMPTNEALLVVILGATSFSVGSHLSFHYVTERNKIIKSREIRENNKFYFLIAALVAICAVEQYDIFINLVSDESFAISLIYARTLMSVDNEDVYGIYKYAGAISLGALLGLQIKMAQRKVENLHKYLFLYFLCASIFMAVLSTGRGPIAFIFLQIGVTYMLRDRKKRLSWNSLALVVGFIFLIFYVFWIMGSAMGKADDNALKALGNLVDYLFSSIPALSVYLELHPIQIIGGEWGVNTFRFLLAVASKTGFIGNLPSLVQDSVPVPHLTNLYTTYLQYGQDFGWIGIVTIPAGIGFFYGSLFKWSMINRRNDFAFYLLVVSYLPLLQSVFQETHFSLMSSWLQFFLIGLVLTRATRKIKINEKKQNAY